MQFKLYGQHCINTHTVRICDTKEYSDTITLTSSILYNASEFLQLMELVTRHVVWFARFDKNWNSQILCRKGFLTVPCKGTDHILRDASDLQYCMVIVMLRGWCSELGWKRMGLGVSEMVCRDGLLQSRHLYSKQTGASMPNYQIMRDLRADWRQRLCG